MLTDVSTRANCANPINDSAPKRDAEFPSRFAPVWINWWGGAEVSLDYCHCQPSNYCHCRPSPTPDWSDDRKIDQIKATQMKPFPVEWLDCEPVGGRTEQGIRPCNVSLQWY